jgi:hypothetical protein
MNNWWFVYKLDGENEWKADADIWERDDISTTTTTKVFLVTPIQHDAKKVAEVLNATLRMQKAIKLHCRNTCYGYGQEGCDDHGPCYFMGVLEGGNKDVGR